jgi:hypothetical protein
MSENKTNKELMQEVEALRKQLDVYSILDEAYRELDGMGKQWVDNNWKSLCTTWAEHMLDPENWGDE